MKGLLHNTGTGAWKLQRRMSYQPIVDLSHRRPALDRLRRVAIIPPMDLTHGCELSHT